MEKYMVLCVYFKCKKTRNLGEKENETATAETLIIEYTT